MKDIAIFGAGGFGREVLALIKDINLITPIWNIVGFFDDGYEEGKVFNGFPNLGGIEQLNQWKTPLSVAVAIGSPAIRRKIVEKIANPLVDYPSMIHPSAWIGDQEYVEIGKGCILCAGVMITASHNPAKYNGYKVYGPDGCQITTEAAAEILAEIMRVDLFTDVKSMDFDAALAEGRIQRARASPA